jgi:hypothetical protein
MFYSSKRPSITTQIFVLLPAFLMIGTIFLLIIGFAAAGETYRAFIARDVSARIAEVVSLCEFQNPSPTADDYRGSDKAIPCNDTAAAGELYRRGFILSYERYRKLKLELQQSPLITTTLVVSNAEVGTLAVGDKLSVRVPILRNSEKVELASFPPASLQLVKLLKYAAFAYVALWILFFLFYRQIREAMVEVWCPETD